MKVERSAAYEAGFSDGCTAATSNGVPRAPQRNETLYASEPDYRAGWGAGQAQCRVQRANSPLTK